MMLLVAALLIVQVALTHGMGLRMVMDLQQLYDLQTQDPCADIAKTNNSKTFVRGRLACQNAYSGWINLHPALKRRCPEADNATCRLGIKKNRWYCTVMIRSIDHGSLFKEPTVKAVPLVWCTKGIDWDALMVNPFSDKWLPRLY